MYSWVPFFTEMAQKLLEYEGRQPDLVAMLRDTGVSGGLSDRDEKGSGIPLTVIDPFTFVAQVTKHGEIKRKDLLAILKTRLGIESRVPTDFNGVPKANPMASWFFSHAPERDPTTIPLLWQFARMVVTDSITPDVFARILALRHIGAAKLTQGMFCLNPEKYLPIDSQTTPFIEKIGIAAAFDDYAGYQRVLVDVRAKLPNKSFWEISCDAWLANQDNPEDPPLHRKVRYWLYAPGRKAEYWDEFHTKKMMAIGWGYLGDLSHYTDKAAIAIAIREHDKDPSSKKNSATCCYSFANVMKVGDVIFAKQGVGRILGYGKVASDYEFDDSRPEFKHIRRVNWIKKGDWEVDEESHFAQKTLTDVSKYPGFLATLKALVGFETPPPGKSRGYWWLNANPKIWNFENTPMGATQVYNSHTPDGAKRQRFKYFAQVAKGDLLVGYVESPVKEVVAICEATAPLGNMAGAEGFKFKKLKQYTNTVTWSELQDIPTLAECEPLKNNQGSLFRLTEDEFETVRGLLEERNPSAPLTRAEHYSMDDALRESLMPPEQFSEAFELLRHKKNLILQGPPGVGKTFLARRLAYVLMSEKAEERIDSVQFHQSYSYEDFIQGIRPTPSGGFTVKDGLFFRFCKRAGDDLSNPYVFLIDEINRGNLSKVLGEAMMLIEADKRGQQVQTAYSEEGETFTIPPNVHIIGTMNTADRSLAMVDYALRRRFCFVGVAPAFRTDEGTKRFEELLVGDGAPRELVREIVSKLRAANEKIAEDTKSLGPDYELGHSYFCAPCPEHYDKSWLDRIVRYELAPLLKEYWFDARDKAEAHIKALLA